MEKHGDYGVLIKLGFQKAMKIFNGFVSVVDKSLIGLEYLQSRSRFVLNVADG